MMAKEYDKFNQPLDATEIIKRSDAILTAEELDEAQKRVEKGEDLDAVALDYAIAYAMKEDDQVIRDAETGWTVTLDGGLIKTYTFPNRRALSQFVETLMQHSNEVNHHPNIETNNESVTVIFKTRASDAVTDLDHRCAEFADNAAEAALKVR